MSSEAKHEGLELIVMLRPGTRAALERGVLIADALLAPPAAAELRSSGARLVPLFGVSHERLVDRAPPGAPDLSRFYRVEGVGGAELDALLGTLAGDPSVEAAYLKPLAEAPVFDLVEPASGATPAVTPDFTSRQGYLDVAPGGIDARYAWTLPGGRGAGVNIMDVEGAWRFTHEDLLVGQGGVIGGAPASDLGWRNHGTAVVGEFGADLNVGGVMGICPDANVRAVSIFGSGMSSASAILTAANALRAGDILLIELHRPGPRFNFQARADQRGYIAVEFWPDDLAAILHATGRGVIVVEAAGNGAENFDDALYDARPAGFPATWTCPFRRTTVDSGAILAGAGAPPPGTHGRDHGTDRSRLEFSNHGRCVDAQGWGREVTTTGYGDLQGGANEDFWYTDTFSGTSSASPIVVGALGCIQGVLRARGRPLLTPGTARELLRSTGSPQQDHPGRPATQRIGNRPNLRRAIASLKPKDTKESSKDSKDRKDAKDRAKELKEKDFKEQLKEGLKEKDFKEQIKELKEVKEKDLKEHMKEVKEKDFKEIKEKTKDVKDRLDVPPSPDGSPVSADLESRVAALEATLEHFIGAELRPDLRWQGGADGDEGSEKQRMDAKAFVPEG